MHQTLSLELVGGHSLLFTWAGSDPGLGPIILLAHYDVVPIEPGTEGDWSHPPFSGRVVEGEVWGRGAMDDKASLLGIMEAAETLLERGFHPTRTLIFSFGHDEEVGGLAGARAVASLLEERGIRGSFVLDEGMAIVEGSLPGVEGPVALIGLAEKGYISVQLSVEVEGPTRMLLESVAPAMPLGMRLVMANLWLFEGAVTRILASAPETDAAIRTTTAPTLLWAGVTRA